MSTEPMTRTVAASIANRNGNLMLSEDEARTLYVPGRASVGGVLGCGLLLALVKAALATVGFRRTLKGIEGITRRREQIGNERPELIGSIAQAVAAASAFYPGRALCLEQSLVFYARLRWARLSARLRLGVSPHPFEAHAWVEYSGKPLYEDTERLKKFLPLLELGR